MVAQSLPVTPVTDAETKTLTPSELGEHVSAEIRKVEAANHVPTAKELYKTYSETLAKGQTPNNEVLDTLVDAAAKEALAHLKGTVFDQLPNIPENPTKHRILLKMIDHAKEMGKPSAPAQPIVEAVVKDGQQGLTGDQSPARADGKAPG